MLISILGGPQNQISGHGTCDLTSSGIKYSYPGLQFDSFDSRKKIVI